MDSVRLHDILKLTAKGWETVEIYKCKNITQAERRLDVLRTQHADVSVWKIVAYKKTENVRTYEPRIF